MLNPAFILYSMEQEGELDTDLGKHNRMIKMLRQLNGISDDDVRDAALSLGLPLPSNQEIEEIRKEVMYATD